MLKSTEFLDEERGFLTRQWESLQLTDESLDGVAQILTRGAELPESCKSILCRRIARCLVLWRSVAKQKAPGIELRFYMLLRVVCLSASSCFSGNLGDTKSDLARWAAGAWTTYLTISCFLVVRLFSKLHIAVDMMPPWRVTKSRGNLHRLMMSLTLWYLLTGFKNFLLKWQEAIKPRVPVLNASLVSRYLELQAAHESPALPRGCCV